MNIVKSFIKIVPEISCDTSAGFFLPTDSYSTVYVGLSRPENGRFQVSYKYNFSISPTSNT